MAPGSAGTSGSRVPGVGAAGSRSFGRARGVGSAGFVLLEVLVATAVMAGGILFAMDALRSAARMTDTAEKRQQAVYLLETRMAEIEEAESLVVGVQTGPFPAPRDAFFHRVTVSAVEQVTGSTSGMLWLVEVEVRYPSRPGYRAVRASRYVWKEKRES